MDGLCGERDAVLGPQTPAAPTPALPPPPKLNYDVLHHVMSLLPARADLLACTRTCRALHLLGLPLLLHTIALSTTHHLAALEALLAAHPGTRTHIRSLTLAFGTLPAALAPRTAALLGALPRLRTFMFIYTPSPSCSPAGASASAVLAAAAALPTLRALALHGPLPPRALAHALSSLTSTPASLTLAGLARTLAPPLLPPALRAALTHLTLLAGAAGLAWQAPSDADVLAFDNVRTLALEVPAAHLPALRAALPRAFPALRSLAVRGARAPHDAAALDALRGVPPLSHDIDVDEEMQLDTLEGNVWTLYALAAPYRARTLRAHVGVGAGTAAVAHLLARVLCDAKPARVVLHARRGEDARGDGLKGVRWPREVKEVRVVVHAPDGCGRREAESWARVVPCAKACVVVRAEGGGVEDEEEGDEVLFTRGGAGEAGV